MRTLRRFLVLIALMFWLGGFTFYVSVVVPVGTRVLGSALDQGMITRQVTVWLNVAGACSLVILLWDALAADPARWRRYLRLALWLFVLSCQVALFALHAHLDAMIDPDAATISDEDAFYRAHRLYLWLHTVQWAAGLVFIVLTLRGWQAEDEGRAVQRAETRLAEWRGPNEDRIREKGSAADRVGVAQSPNQPRGGTK